ncbi:MAG: response regulator [Deltaproteobacteria bacterium]|nr:response regulator [Deltaproteobacteria bacterium]
MPALLLIEDNKVLSLLESRHLSQVFPELDVITAGNGAEALHQARKQTLDAVIMDCHLPDLDFHSLLLDIRKIAPNASIIVASAEPPSDLRVNQGTEQIFEILLKPYETEEFVDTVRRALRATGHTLSPNVISKESVSNFIKDKPVTFDRHVTLNHLSGLLAGLRALEADLDAEAEDPHTVRELVEEYIPRLVGIVHTMTSSIKSITKETSR